MKKTIQTFTTTLAIFLFSLTACKKEDVDKPANTDLGADATGEYEVFYVKQSGQVFNLPQGGVSATLYAEKVDKEQIDLKLIMRDGSTGDRSEADFGTVDLSAESSSIGMYINGEKLGTIRDDIMEIRITDDGGEEFVVRGRK